MSKKLKLQKKAEQNQKNQISWSQKVFKLNPYFEEIIKVDPKDSSKFICMLCTKNLRNQGKPASYQRKNLRNHLMTVKHQNFTPDEETVSLKECIKQLGGDIDNEEESKDNEDDQGKHADEVEELSISKEIDLLIDVSKFLIDHNLPFDIGSKLLQFIQETSQKYDSKLIGRTHTSGTTVTKIIGECIGPCLKDRLLKELKESYFSLLIDESSEVYGGKFIALMVRYLSKDSPKPVTKLLSMIETGKSSTGESIFQKVTKELFDNDLNLESKLIGICSDGGSNLAGRGGDLSLESRIRSIIPHIIHVRDFSHLYNLICKDMLQDFPLYIRTFISDVSSHFSRSTQQKVRLRDTQMNSKAEKILNMKKFVDHRWTSLKESVERILVLWPYLKTHFTSQNHEMAEQFTNEYLLYLNLLSIFLNKICYYIVYFEESDLFYDDILHKIKESYTLMAQLILKENPPEEDIEFEEIFRIDFENPSNEDKNKLASDQDFRTRFAERYPSTQELLLKAVMDKRITEKEFYANAKSLVLNALKSMKAKIPFKDEVLNDSEFIYLQKFDDNVWRKLARKFSNVITKDKENAFEEEISRFRNSFKAIKLKHNNSEKSIVSTWVELSKGYPYMYQLSRALLVLPYSTVDVERLFSSLKLFKTASRNRVSVENIESSLISYQNSLSTTSSNDFRQDEKLMDEIKLRYDELWKNKTKNNEVNLSNSQVQEPQNVNVPNSDKREDVIQGLLTIMQKQQQLLNEIDSNFSNQISLPINLLPNFNFNSQTNFKETQEFDFGIGNVSYIQKIGEQTKKRVAENPLQNYPLMYEDA